MPRSRIKTTLAAILALIFVGFSTEHAAASPHDLLEELLRRALEGSPLITAHEERAEGARALVGYADRLPDPVLGVGYSPVAIETRGGPQRARASLEQSFPFFGKRGLRREEAGFGAAAAVDRAEQTAADVIRSVKSLFWEVYRIDRALEIVNEEARLLDEIVAAADVKYATGGGNQANLLQAQLLRTSTANRLILLRGGREAVVERIEGIIGSDVTIDPLPGTEEVPMNLNRDDLVRRSLEANPDIAVRVENVGRARAGADLARKDFYPDFALSVGWGEVGESDLPGEWNGRDSWSVGAKLKIPLYRGDLRDRERASEAKVRAAEASLEETRIRTEADVDDALHRLQATAESIDLYRTGLIPQARSTYESAMAAYATGELGFADLLVAERSLLDVELGKEEAIALYQKLIAGLDRVIGSRNVDTLFPLRNDG